MTSPALLIVSPDSTFRHTLAAYLRALDPQLRTAADAAEARVVLRHPLAVVIVDLDPTPEAAWPLVEEMARGCSYTGRITCSGVARHAQDIIVGLERGADLYLVKPLDIDLLRAHVQALLRRPRQPALEEPEAPLRFSQLTIDPRQRRAWAGESPHTTPLQLSPGEFDTLLALARHAEQPLSADTLATLVSGEDYLGGDQVLYTRIWSLRRKLGQAPGTPTIETVRGRGYRLTGVISGT